LLDDGNFAIAVPQVCSTFQFLKHNASRELEAILGAGFQFLKVCTTLHPKAVNCITLPDLERVIRALDKKGNVVEVEMADSLIGLSLVQLFSDAFGIKFEVLERQEWMERRMAGKVVRREMTDAIKLYCDLAGMDKESKKNLYINCTKAVNKGVFGMSTREACVERNVAYGKLRDGCTEKELKSIADIENLVIKLIDNKGYEPLTAVKMAVDLMM